MPIAVGARHADSNTCAPNCVVSIRFCKAANFVRVTEGLMVKQRRTDKSVVHLTEREKANLHRFGCTFQARKNMFCIDGRGKTADQASSAEIFANLRSLETKAGPLVVLAFAISVLRPLPSYCYFPFDLTNQVHLKYLTELTRTGEIRLCFVIGKGVVYRSHLLGAYTRLRAVELLAGAQQSLEKCGVGSYSFENALRLLERGVRIPEFVEHLISENDFSEILKHVKREVQLVPNEKRDLARHIVKEALGSFQPYFEKNKQFLLGNWFDIRRGLLALADLHRLFADNVERSFAEFMSDAIAATFSPEDLDKLKGWVQIGGLLLLLPPLTKPAPEPPDPMTMPQLPVGLADIFGPLAEGRGISQDSPRRLAELLDFPIGGKPGRPTKDYSQEYELRTSGLSWSELTRQALAEGPELQAEFGRDFDSLDHGDRERLQNRIRQGVIAYAKRTGKPLPSEAEVSGPTPGKPEQKTP